MPTIGKISAEIFDEIILPQLGKVRPEVLTGPQHGVDVGVVDLGGGQVMVTTTDPLFVVPPYGWERSGWFAVHILASDAVTSGLPPKYITMDLNLPLAVTRDQFEALWSVMHRECERLGMAIVSGHTGRYEGCDFPMIGGATVICVGPKDQYVTPAMAQVNDLIVITKGAAIEASALFAVTFPEKVADRYGEQFAAEAEQLFWQMSVVEDALTAVSVGVRENGVTTLHDATECGIWGGLFEIAQASGVGMAVEKNQIMVQEPVRKVCDLFGIDPYIAISEGSLIATCRPHKVKELLERLEHKGIPVSIVGEITEARHGLHYFDGGRRHALVHPRVDPFWAAFGKAASEKSP